MSTCCAHDTFYSSIELFCSVGMASGIDAYSFARSCNVALTVLQAGASDTLLEQSMASPLPLSSVPLSSRPLTLIRGWQQQHQKSTCSFILFEGMVWLGHNHGRIWNRPILLQSDKTWHYRGSSHMRRKHAMMRKTSVSKLFLIPEEKSQVAVWFFII